jgi:uncharacterized protein
MAEEELNITGEYFEGVLVAYEEGHFMNPLTENADSMVAGWQPIPFLEFIVKVHSRCNLACDYCYMYEMADQSWRDQPRVMSEETAELTAFRIGEHATAHQLSRVFLILHGGEPLLAGRHLISTLVTRTRMACPGVRVEAGIQTNAVRLSDSHLELFDELGIAVGVSLDGDAMAHDRHRRFADGRGSYEATVAGLELLRQFPRIYRGLLCTIDLRNDPIKTYETLIAFEPPRISFLLPHGTWDAPPPGRPADPALAPYADWLIPIFDRWFQEPWLEIPLFESIMRLLRGGVADSEAVGLAPARMVVVATDGSIEQVDSLKSAFDGASATGLHIRDSTFDTALLMPEIAARQLGIQALSEQCRSCRLLRICGGGQYPHRYRTGTGFANPSVYCPDLMRLIDHIHSRIHI